MKIRGFSTFCVLFFRFLKEKAFPFCVSLRRKHVCFKKKTEKFHPVSYRTLSAVQRGFKDSLVLTTAFLILK